MKHNTKRLKKTTDGQRPEPILGINTGFASTPINTSLQNPLVKKLENNTRKYYLQKIVKRYHPENRVSACMHAVKTDQEHIELHYNQEDQSAHYRNLMRCDNVWMCPVCSARITSERAEEIRQAYTYATTQLNWFVVLVTYTMAHKQWHTLQDTVNDIRIARRKMRSGRSWQKFREEYGYMGCISSLEVTYGDNGWHPHVHELMFLDPTRATMPIGDEEPRWVCEQLHRDITPEWLSSVEKVGRSASSKRGLDVAITDNEITDYIAKYGRLPQEVTWDIALELTKSQSKTGGNGLHAFTILELSDCKALDAPTRKKYRALWHEYVDAFSGRAQIYWTQGLKDLVLHDLPYMEGEEPEAKTTVMYLSYYVWRDICQLWKRSEVLNNCILWEGDHDKLNRYLKKLSDQALFERNKKTYKKLITQEGS